MEIVKSIFMKLANMLGMTLQKKPIEYTNEFYKPISITNVIAETVATITVDDSEVNVVGDSKKAQFLDYIANEFNSDILALAATIALGTGDCLIKPFTDGEKIGIDVVTNENFVVCDSVGNFIKSAIIKCDELRHANDVYQRFEAQQMLNGGVKIYNYCFKNGNLINLTDVQAWADIPENIFIANCPNLLFGRIKNPVVNRLDINGVNGVPITNSLNKLMQKALEAYFRFNSEFELSEKFIFADKTLFIRDKNGEVVLPSGKNKLFHKIRGNTDNNNLIHEFNPQIRQAEMTAGIEENFKMLEMFAGFSNGILTSPTTNYATATEMKNSLKKTFAFVKKFRRGIERGTQEFFNAVSVIANRNNLVVDGKWDLKWDWSYDYVEESREKFNQLIQMEAAGIVDKAEVRAWGMNEAYEIAQEKIKQMQETQIFNE